MSQIATKLKKLQFIVYMDIFCGLRFYRSYLTDRHTDVTEAILGWDIIVIMCLFFVFVQFLCIWVMRLICSELQTVDKEMHLKKTKLVFSQIKINGKLQQRHTASPQGSQSDN